jgi:hypothetical protein
MDRRLAEADSILGRSALASIALSFYVIVIESDHTQGHGHGHGSAMRTDLARLACNCVTSNKEEEKGLTSKFEAAIEREMVITDRIRR